MYINENGIFEMARKFKQLNILERLGVMSHSEGVVMQTVITTAKNEKKGCRVSDIAKELGVTSPAISRIIKKLREKGYVESVINDSDRRNTYIMVTRNGKNALEIDLKKMNNFMDMAMKNITKEEIQNFRAIYDKIYDSFKETLDGIK